MTVIGVDARATEPGFKAHYGRGTGRYAEELLRHLPKVNDGALEIRPIRSEDLAKRKWEDNYLT